MKKGLLLATILLASSSASAELIKVHGEGKAPINKKDLNTTRSQAFDAAKQDAVISFIKKINGPQAINEAQTYLTDIVKQVDTQYVFNQGSQQEGNELLTRVSIEMDDQAFREILNDYGLSKKSTRTSPIMIVMDEYFGVPRDTGKPAKEFVSFYSDKSYAYDENARASSSVNSSSSNSVASSKRSNASAAAAAGYANYYGVGVAAAASRSSQSSNYRSNNSDQYRSAESASYAQSERQNDIQSFVKYVEYQTPSLSAEKDNQTLNSIAAYATKYDLRLMDSDLFRSKYLQGRSIIVQQLLSDSELAKFAAAARAEKADWFMAGSSHIFDRGRSMATGQYVCDGAISFKVYSVEDGTLLGGHTRTESSAGASANACRTSVAAKLGQLAMSEVGPQILNYGKNRSMYGKEFTIFVKSPTNTVSTRFGDDLYIALEGMPGAQNINIRTQDGSMVEATMTYKNDKPITVELAKALRGVNPTLFAAERLQQGNSITLCLGGTQCK